jgi:hypothetical protein
MITTTFYIDTLNNLQKGLARLSVDSDAHLLGGRISKNYQVSGFTQPSGEHYSDGMVIKSRDLEGNPIHPRSLNNKIIYYHRQELKDSDGNLRPRIFIQEAKRQGFKTKRLITITTKDGVSLIFEPSKRKLLAEQKQQYFKNRQSYLPMKYEESII